jgi:hypothetical protein
MTDELETLREVREALASLLRRDESNTCPHEETHRGGCIWEICNWCGAKWADDEGGKPPFEAPKEWVDALDAITNLDRLIAEVEAA